MGFLDKYYDWQIQKNREKERLSTKGAEELESVIAATSRKQLPFSLSSFNMPSKGGRGFRYDFFSELEKAYSEDELRKTKERFIRKVMAGGRTRDVSERRINKLFEEWIEGKEGSDDEDDD